MKRVPSNDPDNDFEVEITPLDMPTTSERRPDTFLEGSRLAPRVRTWLTVLSGMGGILLMVIVLMTVLPSLLPKTKTTPTPSTIHMPPSQVQNVTAHNDIAYVTSSDGMGRAFRVKDGSLLWQHTLPDVTPVFINDTLYLSYFDQQFYTVQALRVSDGKILWTFKTTSSDFLPLIIDDGIVTSLSNSPVQNYGQSQAQSRAVLALDSSTGTELWEYSMHITAQASMYVQSMQDKTYISVWSDYQMHNLTLFVLKSSDGQLLWHYTNPDLRQTLPNISASPMIMLPLISDGPVYMRMADGSIRAMDTNNGHEVWYYKPANPDDITQMTGTRHFYIQTIKSAIKALRFDNGKVDWSYNDPAGIITIFSETDGILYAKSGDGFVVALRANDGKLLWRVQSVAPPFSFDTLYIEGNAAYTFTQIGNATYVTVAALRVSDGTLLWKSKVSVSGGMLFPVISKDQLFIDVGTAMIALRARDGTVLWRANNLQSDFQYGFPLSLVENAVFLRLSSGALEVHQAETGAVSWRYPR